MKRLVSRTVFHTLYEKVSWSLGLVALTFVLSGVLPSQNPSTLVGPDLHVASVSPRPFLKLSAQNVLSHAKAWRQYTNLALMITKPGECVEPQRGAAEALPLH